MTEHTLAKLYWEESQEDVTSLDQLVVLIAKLEVQASKEYPFMGTLCIRDECLSVGFGSLRVPVMYISPQNNEILYSLGDSMGKEEMDEDVVFFYQGSWSRFGKRTTITCDSAVSALKEFYLYGRRSEKINWQYERHTT